MQVTRFLSQSAFHLTWDDIFSLGLDDASSAGGDEILSNLPVDRARCYLFFGTQHTGNDTHT